jgi:hypothetical protein
MKIIDLGKRQQQQDKTQLKKSVSHSKHSFSLVVIG